jgi:2-methylcitrate dehydratase PrpD
MSKQRPPVTAEIAQVVANRSLGADTAELRALATRALLDTVGVTIAARREEGVLTISRALAGESAPGRSTIWTSGERVSETQASLVNGMASHALDYDDVFDPMYGHSSAAMFPALLAVAEREQVSGSALLDAYTVGVQVVDAVAAGLPIRKHYSRGWHSTSTVGVIGATAGVCRLLRLPELSVRHAVGIAASTAAGSRQNFGTMTKPLHPGLASHNAVIAARLAQEGFTADPSQLEAELGYFAMYGVDSDLDAVLAKLHGPWSLLATGLNVKKYPCCYNTHRTIDATLALTPRVGGNTSSIDVIRLTVEPGGFDPLIHHRPQTGLEGKFSAEYVIAAGLLDGHVGLETFTDAAVRRSDAQELLRKVEVAESETPPWGETGWEYAYATLEVVRGDEVLRERVDIPAGDTRAPLSDAQVGAKFRDCLAYADAGFRIDDVLQEFLGIGEVEHLTGFASLDATFLVGAASGA